MPPISKKLTRALYFYFLNNEYRKVAKSINKAFQLGDIKPKNSDWNLSLLFDRIEAEYSKRKKPKSAQKRESQQSKTSTQRAEEYSESNKTLSDAEKSASTTTSINYSKTEKTEIQSCSTLQKSEIHPKFETGIENNPKKIAQKIKDINQSYKQKTPKVVPLNRLSLDAVKNYNLDSYNAHVERTQQDDYHSSAGKRLMTKTGKNFSREKNKKKRNVWVSSAAIDGRSHSIIFDSD